MNLLQLPWVAVLVAILALVALVLREVAVLFDTPRWHPDRKLSWFNMIVLLALIAVVAFGARWRYEHVTRLAALVPLFPEARYAPERELFRGTADWIFVTKASEREIVAFYEKGAERGGYEALHDSTDQRKLFLRTISGGVFLTVRSEGEVTVLYYGTEGEIRNEATER